jgi:hypothetical protein
LLLSNDAEVDTVSTARAPLITNAASSHHCHDKKPNNKEEECDVRVGSASVSTLPKYGKMICSAVVV